MAGLLRSPAKMLAKDIRGRVTVVVVDGHQEVVVRAGVSWVDGDGFFKLRDRLIEPTELLEGIAKIIEGFSHGWLDLTRSSERANGFIKPAEDRMSDAHVVERKGEGGLEFHRDLILLDGFKNAAHGPEG